jgi:hypothetical protein
MNLGKAAVALLLLATPALAGSSKSAGDVTFVCEVTGSGDDGFTITAKNEGSADKSCDATCKLDKASGGSKSWSYSAKVRASPQKFYFGGEAGVSGAPLSNPNVTDASCS